MSAMAFRSDAPRAEMRLTIPYHPIALNGSLGDQEFSIALCDIAWRLVDRICTTDHHDVVVQNHPRPPSHCRGFVGAATRIKGSGDDAIGRMDVNIDTASGADNA